MCMYVYLVPGVYTSLLLKLEIQMVISCHVCDSNWIYVFRKNRQYSWLLSHVYSPKILKFVNGKTKFIFKERSVVVVNSFNPSTWETKVGVPNQIGLHSRNTFLINIWMKKLSSPPLQTVITQKKSLSYKTKRQFLELHNLKCWN